MSHLLRSFPRLLILYLVTLIACVFADPGLVKLYKSLAYDLNEGQTIVIRLVVLGLTAGIVMAPLLLRSRIYVALYLMVLFPLMVTGITFRLINGDFTSWEAGLVLNEFGFADDAIIEFTPQIIKACAISTGVLLLLFFLRVPLGGGRIFTLLLLGPWLLPIAYLHAAQGGYWSKHFVLPVKVPTMLTYEIMNPLPIMERESVNIKASPQRRTHIVYLVDESIRGDLLSINNPAELTTLGLMALTSRYHADNYGVVSAAANCSAPSNLLLRTGLRPDQLPDSKGSLFSQANIFQYASKAGFKTYYLDAQVEAARLQNFFTQHEIEKIDEYLPIKSHAQRDEYLLDQELADSVIERIQTAEQPLFIYANKVGTHFPYEKTYPEPAADLDKNEHYRAALGWSVDRFLEHLVTGLHASGEAVRVIYTSDHGQGLGEKGSDSTHCLPYKPANVQASVPLLVFTLNDDASQRWQPRTGGYSHFQIFPTILQMMGYATEDVIERYGVDLSIPWPGERYFYSGDLTGRGQLSQNHFDS